MRREIINLLKSATPFVGEKGKTMIELAAYLNDLITSDAAQKTISVFSTLNPPQAMVVGEDAELQSLEDTNPFGLFLILILLIMATGSLKSKEYHPQESKGDIIEI